MSFTVYDTSTSSTATCGALDEAIRMVEAALRMEEIRGRRVEREEQGRWAIHDEDGIDLVWIEADNGAVVSFAR